MPKTLAQITGEIITSVVNNFSPKLIDTRTGTVVKEAFVNPAAAQFKQSFDALDTITLNQSVANAASMTSSALELLGANVGVAIKQGTKSTGFVRCVKVVSPTGVIPIPAGTTMATQLSSDGALISFVSLSSVQLTPTSPADPVTGAQAYVDVFVQSIATGAANNVDAGTISSLTSPIPGIDQIFNPAAMSGGSDLQSNQALAANIQSHSQGNLGTRPGYKNIILSNIQAQDVLVLGSGDAGIARNQFGGSVDVVILGSDIVTTTDTFAYTGQTVLNPSVLPLISVGVLSGFDALSSPLTFVGPVGGVGAGTDYDVILDTTGPFAGSITENSRVVLHFTTAVPAGGSFLTLTYANNQLIRAAQAFLAEEDNDILGSDVIAKSGIKINANVAAQIKVIPGYDPTTTINAAAAAVIAFFDALLLGIPVEESQILSVISGVAGVSFVDVPGFVLALSSAPLVPLQQILANNQEFVRASIVSIAAI